MSQYWQSLLPPQGLPVAPYYCQKYQSFFMTPDQINSCFEFVAGVLLTFNVVRIYRDKQAKGVSIVPLAFMVAWGLWNCYFYPYMGAMWSFWCGLGCTTVNAIWISQMIYYKIQEKYYG